MAARITDDEWDELTPENFRYHGTAACSRCRGRAARRFE